MARIKFTNTAREDSRSIFADLQTKSGKVTVEKYLTGFSRLYDHLADFPESGAIRPKSGVTVRIGIVFPYVVFYRYVEADDRPRNAKRLLVPRQPVVLLNSQPNKINAAVVQKTKCKRLAPPQARGQKRAHERRNLSWICGSPAFAHPWKIDPSLQVRDLKDLTPLRCVARRTF
jgi:plasmid stabilization system protein ParE